MPDWRAAVGDIFEGWVAELFDLERIDINRTGGCPDLISRKYNFVVEVKASAYDNGGVITENQLEAIRRLGEKTNMRRFYIFVYHSINKDMAKTYHTKEELEAVLDLRSLYVMPFSTAEEYFHKFKKMRHPNGGTFVQLKESQAEKIFNRDPAIWDILGLNWEAYQFTTLYNKVKIITSGDYLKEELIASFHPEFLDRVYDN